MATTRITGTDAITYAEEHDLTLSSYADPTEDGREGLTVSDAREIESEGGEVYLDIVWLTARTITDDEIRELQTEAGAAGDDEQVKICDRALAGRGGRGSCANTINSARAM